MADITIDQVREKFPQYKDLSDEQLAQGLHKKFYADMPYDQFSTKVGLKTETSYLPGEKFATGLIESGAGEIGKGVGAAVGLVAPETGKQIREYYGGIQKEAEKVSPTGAAIGKPLSYAVPFSGALKGTKALSGALGLGEATGLLGSAVRAGEATTAAGAVGAATTPGTLGERAKQGAIDAAIAGVFPVGELVLKGGKTTYSILKRAFGNDAKKAADALRDYAARRGGNEAKAANALADRAQQDAAIAERAAPKQAGRAEQAAAVLPGVQTQKMAGRFRPIGKSEQELGDAITKETDRVFNELKAVRQRKAEANKQAAFDYAAEQETKGLTVNNTKAAKDLLGTIDRAITDSSVPAVQNELKSLRNAISGQFVNEAGDVVTRKVNFNAFEQMRRFLNDRAYGIPSEGFNAMKEQMAGDLGKKVEAAMTEFSPEMRKFIQQYKKDSEPLRVFKTKVGKALVGEQLPGVEGFPTVVPEDIPGRVFKNREAFQSLVDAVGGNKEFAEAQARRYFASKLQELGTDAKKIENFILKNRDQLKLTNARGMAEDYLAKVRAGTGAGEALGERGKVSREAEQAARKAGQEFERLSVDIRNARTPQEVAAETDKLALRLYQQGTISSDVYAKMGRLAQNVRAKAGDKQAALSEVYSGVRKILGYGTLGTLGYLGARQFGKE
jgi:hypothetical protein